MVEVTDDDGRSGYGEAPQVWQVTGASVAGAEACVRTRARPGWWLGRDADDVLARCAEMAATVAGNEAARSALDVALHDLAARRLGVPLVRLLGGTALRVPTDVTLAAGDGAELATAARQRQGEGFDVLKLKVGTDAAGDLDRVRAVRAAVGPQARIRLDANQGWTDQQEYAPIAIWLLGLGWLAATVWTGLRPDPIGWILGSAAAAFGLLFVDWPRSPWLVVAVLTGIALVAVGVRTQRWPVVAIGIVGLLFAVPITLGEMFGTALLPVWVALGIGLALLVGAVVVMRRPRPQP